MRLKRPWVLLKTDPSPLVPLLLVPLLFLPPFLASHYSVHSRSHQFQMVQQAVSVFPHITWSALNSLHRELATRQSAPELFIKALTFIFPCLPLNQSKLSELVISCFKLCHQINYVIDFGKSVFLHSVSFPWDQSPDGFWCIWTVSCSFFQNPQWRICTCSSVFALIYLQKRSAGQHEQELLSLFMITWITFLYLYFLLWSRKKRGAFIVPSKGLRGEKRDQGHKIFWWGFTGLVSLKKVNRCLSFYHIFIIRRLRFSSNRSSFPFRRRYLATAHWRGNPTASMSTWVIRLLSSHSRNVRADVDFVLSSFPEYLSAQLWGCERFSGITPQHHPVLFFSVLPSFRLFWKWVNMWLVSGKALTKWKKKSILVHGYWAND